MGLYMGLCGITLCEFILVIMSAVAAALFKKNKVKSKEHQKTSETNRGFALENDELDAGLELSLLVPTSADELVRTPTAALVMVRSKNVAHIGTQTD